jgi:predicted transcriptional regulator
MSVRSRLNFAKNVALLLTDDATRNVFDAIGSHRYMYPLLLADAAHLDADTVQRAVNTLKTSGLVGEQTDGGVSVYYLTMDGLHVRKDLRGVISRAGSLSELTL